MVHGLINGLLAVKFRYVRELTKLDYWIIKGYISNCGLIVGD
jgi:ABC-type maltose transport system permease subunit